MKLHRVALLLAFLSTLPCWAVLHQPLSIGSPDGPNNPPAPQVVPSNLRPNDVRVKTTADAAKHAREILGTFGGINVVVDPTTREETGGWSPQIEPGEQVWRAEFAGVDIQFGKGAYATKWTARTVTVVFGKLDGDLKYIKIDDPKPTISAPDLPDRTCFLQQLAAAGEEVWSKPGAEHPVVTLIGAVEEMRRVGSSSVENPAVVVAHYIRWKSRPMKGDCDAWSIDCRGIPDEDATGERRLKGGCHHLRHIVQCADKRWRMSISTPSLHGCAPQATVPAESKPSQTPSPNVQPPRPNR